MKPEEMIQARIKARNDWFKSMHLRPVYYLEESADDIIYIAIAPRSGERVRRRAQQLCLFPVEERASLRYVSYNDRGMIFPWDDISTATEVVFKSKVAAKREELKKTYGVWNDE